MAQTGASIGTDVETGLLDTFLLNGYHDKLSHENDDHRKSSNICRRFLSQINTLFTVNTVFFGYRCQRNMICAIMQLYLCYVHQQFALQDKKSHL